MPARLTSWHLYVLLCGDGTLYTGIALNVEARVQAHSEGRGARYTKGRAPFKLLHREEVGTKSDALKAERNFKALPKAKKLLRIEGGKGQPMPVGPG